MANISRTGKQAEDTNIKRAAKNPGRFSRSEHLAVRFGYGKYGVGRFSRKKIVREKL